MDRFSKSQGFLPGLVEGEVSERFKVLAWKASVGSRPPGVRIPPSPNLPNFRTTIRSSEQRGVRTGNYRAPVA